MSDYIDDLKINENDLESEWISQAGKYMFYADQWAKAVLVRDTAKIKAEYTYAKLDTEIRGNWNKYFDSKPTEGAIKGKIIQHDDYQDSQKHLVECNEDVNVYYGCKVAFDHRKTALQSLVQIRLSGFHAEPRNIHRDKAIKNKDEEEVKTDNKRRLNKSKRLKTATKQKGQRPTKRKARG